MWRLVYRALIRARGWLNVLIAAARRRAYPRLRTHRPDTVLDEQNRNYNADIQASLDRRP